MGCFLLLLCAAAEPLGKGERERQGCGITPLHHHRCCVEMGGPWAPPAVAFFPLVNFLPAVPGVD